MRDPPRPPGMEAMFIGKRTGTETDEIVAITVWRDLDALIALFGAKWSEPSFFAELEEAIIDRRWSTSRRSLSATGPQDACLGPRIEP